MNGLHDMEDNNRRAGLQRAYHLFTRVYRGRDDFTAVRRNGKYARIPGGFTFDRFEEHIGLAETYALYNMDDENRVSFCLFDLDVLPRKQKWEVLVEKIAIEKQKAFQAIDTLLSYGLREENILAEFPTVGYHLILSFSNPLPAVLAKKFMQKTLAESGLDQTPYYPNNIEPGTHGDRVQLPFRINLNSGKRSNLISDLASFDPENYDQTPDFSPLAKVEPVDSDLILKVL